MFPVDLLAEHLHGVTGKIIHSIITITITIRVVVNNIENQTILLCLGFALRQLLIGKRNACHFLY